MINDVKHKLAGIRLNSTVQYGLLAAITILAAALRLYKLGAWSFWFDEIFTLKATPHISEWPLARLPINLVFIRGALELFGTSEWSARLAPALVGILTVPILYFPTRKIFDPTVALISALLLAVAPWHLFWSQNVRFYALLFLFYNFGLLLLFIGLEGNRRWYLAFGIFFLLLALREKITAFFLVPVVASYLLALMILPFGKPAWLRLRLFVLVLIPGIIYILYDGYSFLTRGYSQILALFGIFAGKPSNDPFRLLSFISFNIGLPLMCLAFFGGVYLLLQKNRAGLFLVIGAIVPIVLLLLMSPFVFTKDRYVFATLSSWIVLAAIASKEIFFQSRDYGKVLATGVLVLLLADAAGSNLLYYQVNNGNRRDWKGAFALVQQQSQEGDVLVTFWPELTDYYLDREVISWQDITPEMVKQSDKRFWFIIDSETVWANKRMKWWIEQNGDLIEVKYLRTPDDFYLRTYLYDPKSSKQ